jgi:hypothetical protein
MSRSPGTGGSLSVDEEALFLSVYGMLFFLARVVGHIIEEDEVCLGEDFPESLAGEVSDDLAIGEGTIHSRPHGAEISLAQRGANGSAGELTVWQGNAIFGCFLNHLSEEVGADLVSQAPGATVNHHDRIALIQAISPGEGFVINFGNVLNLQVMIAGAQSSHFVSHALFCLGGDLVGLGAVGFAMLFNSLEVFFRPVSSVYSPLGSMSEHSVHFVFVQANFPPASDACRDRAEEDIREALLDVFYVLTLEPGEQTTDPTGDIKSDSSRGHNAPFFRVKGSDASYGEAVSPVGIGHGKRGLHDSRECSHVANLLIDFVIHRLYEFRAGIDDSRDAHIPVRLYPPFVIRFAD